MRAQNRHQAQRIKERRKWYWSALYDGEELSGVRLGIAAKTPKACGCWMCKNPRHREGPSIAEKRQTPV